MKTRLETIEKILDGQPEYRLKQAYNAVYKQLIEDWSQAFTLPQKVRSELDQKAPLTIKGQIIEMPRAIKAILPMKDGVKIETVLLKHGDRNTVCVSSQAGCPLFCLFCHTGKLGFNRNLTAEEITDQVLYFFRLLKRSNQTVNNVVFMGMGEPMLNYPNVLKAIEWLNHPQMFDISARKISISTAGIPEKIRKFARLQMQANLAISLNAPNDELRSKLMPINNKYPLNKLLDAIRYYIKLTHRKVMFEYVMIQNLNDSIKEAEQLVELLKGLLCVVNLIPYNGGGRLKAPSQKTINEFKQTLSQHHIQVTQRYRLGTPIAAACGQLLFSQTQAQQDPIGSS